MATMRLCSWLLVLMLMSLTVCEARGLPQRSVPGGNNVEASLQLMPEKINQLEMAIESSKRGCNSVLCMAAKQELIRFQLSKLSECANDPNCSPGKRRRRSATAQAVLSLLTRDGNRTS